MAQPFRDLIEQFPTWETLGPFLKSAEGGFLRIIGISPLVLIRYQKGESNFDISHVKFFRSVVWNTLTNRPVSVTPYKSEPGECVPIGAATEFIIETFMDGVLIGQFWDGTSWKIHTRSMLGAKCRYYSEKTFKTMFSEAIQPEELDKTVCYSWILQHPENRIVCGVPRPRVILVGANQIKEDGTIVSLSRTDLSPLNEYLPNSYSFTTWDAMRTRLLEWNERYRHNFQGFVIHTAAKDCRWKIRSESYNKARLMRENTPRRDYVWLTQWKAKTLKSYLKIFPEEASPANAIVFRWKGISTELFQIYTAKFKAKSSPEVPPKFKGILHSMHQHYYNVLKPAGKTLTLPEAIEWLNQRDVPQMLYLINFELRVAMAAVEDTPFEPTVITSADMPTPTPTPTPTHTPTYVVEPVPGPTPTVDAAPAVEITAEVE